MITTTDMLNWLDEQIHKPQSIEDGDMLEVIRSVVFNEGQRQLGEQREIEERLIHRQNLKQLYGMSRELTKGSVI